MDMQTSHAQSRDEFLIEHEKTHPRPTLREIAETKLPSLTLRRVTDAWEFWGVGATILLAALVSVFRVQGSFFDIARKDAFLFGVIPTSDIESVGAAALFDLAIIIFVSVRSKFSRKKKQNVVSIIDRGLMLALVVTGLTNAQQGFKHFVTPTLDTPADYIAVIAQVVFVLALSAGVPVLAALLAHLLGNVMDDIAEDNATSTALHKQECEHIRHEYALVVDAARKEFDEAVERWGKQADAAYARQVKTSGKGAANVMTNAESVSPSVQTAHDSSTIDGQVSGKPATVPTVVKPLSKKERHARIVEINAKRNGHGPMTNSEIVEMFGVNARTADRDIADIAKLSAQVTDKPVAAVEFVVDTSSQKEYVM